MKKKSRFAAFPENKELVVCLHIFIVNYKHIRALYGCQCCTEILEFIQSNIFIFGFSFLSIGQDEMVISLRSRNTEVKLLAEALLLFFSTNNFFGRYLPIMPVLSISEVVSSSVDAGSLTSIQSKSASFPTRLKPPQLTSKWRAAYEAEMNFCQRLVTALEKGGCSLNLQPVYDMSGGIFYSEALLRFSDNLCKIDTQKAIDAFERTGQIRLVDRYVVNAVIGRLKSDSMAVIACNISALSFNLDFWWESALKDLKKYPAVANRLVVELTEGAIIEDQAAFLKFAKALKALGVRFALDDFGAGMPRAAAINGFIFDYIKLDKGVIRDLRRDSIKFQMILNLVAYLKNVGAQVVAEGIEDEGDVFIAKELGCSYMQGYHLGYPSSKNNISIKTISQNEYNAFGLCV